MPNVALTPPRNGWISVHSGHSALHAQRECSTAVNLSRSSGPLSIDFHRFTAMLMGEAHCSGDAMASIDLKIKRPNCHSPQKTEHEMDFLSDRGRIINSASNVVYARKLNDALMQAQ